MKTQLTRWAGAVVVVGAVVMGFLFVSQTRGQGEPGSSQSAPSDATKVAVLKGDEQLMNEALKSPVAPKIPAPPTAVPGPTATPYYPDATPAGDGILLPYGPGQPLKGINLYTTWRQVLADGTALFVYVGELQDDLSQGIIVVEGPATDQTVRPITKYLLPVKADAVRISGAAGNVLILEGAGGQTFEFDVDQRTVVAK